jgi:glutaminyl-peptide cyclotransferase
LFAAPLLVFVATCPAAAQPSGETQALLRAARMQARVVAAYPHDARAFTQGLALHEGKLYESTGLVGRSSLREVEVETGKVLRRIDVSPPLFGEGVAIAGDRVVQLTWKNRVALVYRLEDLEKIRDLSYQGEGWGLCFDGTRLVMSDGSDTLYRRDPETFAEQERIRVTLDGVPLPRLNELECVGDSVYANVWLSDRIVRIDPGSGHVTAVVDAAGLLTAEERKGSDVLNGIAYDAATDTFLLTGKLWPKLFRVKFVHAGAAAQVPRHESPSR